MRIGLHASTSGGVDNAPEEVLKHEANCFQIFSSSPRTWRASPLDPARVKRQLMLREKHDLAPMAIHCNYLINLAASDENVLRQSVIAFRGELERAIALRAEYLVLHPGNRKGHADPDDGIRLAAASLGATARGLNFANGPKLLFENTAGAGSAIGSQFKDLAALTQMAAQTAPHLPIGFCIDTCHCLAAGYDVASAAGLESVTAELESLLGFENIPVIHANDSKGALGSHLDRHANIGEGQIGEQGFARILQHPSWRGKAFIIETPYEDEGAERDLAALRRLSVASTAQASSAPTK